MTNAQLYFAMGLPIFAILTSLIVSLVQISAIRSDMRDLRMDVKSDLAENKAEMRLLRADVKATWQIFVKTSSCSPAKSTK